MMMRLTKIQKYPQPHFDATKTPFTSPAWMVLCLSACVHLLAGCGAREPEETSNATASTAAPPILAELHEGVINLDPAELLKAAPPWMSLSGEPTLSEAGDAVYFSGVEDGFYLERTPLAGLSTFTVEVVFKQGDEASTEPRFLHIGEVNGGRMMLETRLTEEGYWALDSFFRAGENYLVLLDMDQLHPVNEWAHVAVVMEEGKVKNYVNGRLEMEGEIDFTPINSGRTSIGMRLNGVHWFNGEIRHIRITPSALSPTEFTLLD